MCELDDGTVSEVTCTTLHSCQSGSLTWQSRRPFAGPFPNQHQLRSYQWKLYWCWVHQQHSYQQTKQQNFFSVEGRSHSRSPAAGSGCPLLRSHPAWRLSRWRDVAAGCFQLGLRRILGGPTGRHLRIYLVSGTSLPCHDYQTVCGSQLRFWASRASPQLSS
jgi:hypothetical protein